MTDRQRDHPAPATPPAYAAVLLPVTVPWGSPAARERLWADESGALCWTDGSGPPVVLAAPGEIVGARLASQVSTHGLTGFVARLAGEGPHEGPLLLLDRRDASPVVVGLGGWWPPDWPPDPAKQLTDSGARALLAALGREDAFTFDVGEPDDTTFSGRPRVLDPRRTLERQGRRALLFIRIAGLLALLAYLIADVPSILFGVGDGEKGVRVYPWVLVLATLCWLVPVAATWWERRQATRLPDVPDGARRVTAAGPDGPVAWLERTDDGALVVLRAGTATAVPGAGSPTRATAMVPRGRTTAAVLLSSGTTRFAALAPRGGLTAESVDQVRSLLDEAGVPWEERTVPEGSPELTGLDDAVCPSPWDGQVGLLGALVAVATAGAAVGAEVWFLVPVNLATLAVAVLLMLQPRRRSR